MNKDLLLEVLCVVVAFVVVVAITATSPNAQLRPAPPQMVSE